MRNETEIDVGSVELFPPRIVTEGLEFSVWVKYVVVAFFSMLLGIIVGLSWYCLQ